MPEDVDNAMPTGRDADQAPGHPSAVLAEAGDFHEADTEEIFNTEADDDAPEQAAFSDEFEAEWEEPAEAPHASHRDAGHAPDMPGPELPPRVHRGARGANSGPGTPREPRALPVYLKSLCALPGVDRSEFEHIDCRTAYIELWATKPRSNRDKLPLGHLAPDAVEVLTEMRFVGHVRAAVFESEHARAPLFHTAFKIPVPAGEENQPADAAMYELEATLRAEIDDLRKVAAQAGQSPFQVIREMLAGVREVIHEAGELRNELQDMAGLDLDQQPGEEGGGTAEAVLAVVAQKAQQFAQSETAARLWTKGAAMVNKFLEGRK